MDKSVHDRIAYHVEALKVSNEKSHESRVWLESHKNYKSSGIFGVPGTWSK